MGVQKQGEARPRAPHGPHTMELAREGDPEVLSGDVEDVTLVEFGDGVMIGHRNNGLRVGLVTPAWKPNRQILLIAGDDGVKVAAEEGLTSDSAAGLVGDHALAKDVKVSFEPGTTADRKGQRPRSGTRVTSAQMPALKLEDAVRAERDRSWALGWVRRLFGERPAKRAGSGK